LLYQLLLRSQLIKTDQKEGLKSTIGLPVNVNSSICSPQVVREARNSSAHT